MTPTRFLADTMPQALDAARRELGGDLNILHAATHRTGGLWPFGRVVEAEVVAEPRGPRDTPPERAAQANLRAAVHTHAHSAPHVRPSEVRLRLAARLALARAVAAAHGAAAAAAHEVDHAMQQARAAGEHGTPQVIPAIVGRMAARLRAQGLSEDLVQQVSARVIADLGDATPHDAAATPGRIRNCFVNAVAALLPLMERSDPTEVRAEGKARVIAVVGPTGVGKTTTVAKLAADCRVRLGLRVGIVAADSYRVGAVDQLRAYAQILGAPLSPADSPWTVRSAMLDLAWCDVILVDTAGRSHRDTGRIGEINSILRAAQPHETHLVLSGSAAPRSLQEATRAFNQMRPTSVVLSKLDECEMPGVLVQAVRQAGCPVSWLTTGQEVPDDIERATAEGIAARVVDSADLAPAAEIALQRMHA